MTEDGSDRATVPPNQRGPSTWRGRPSSAPVRSAGRGGGATAGAKGGRPRSAFARRAPPLVPQAAAAEAASIQEDMAARIGMPVGALPSLSRQLTSSKPRVGLVTSELSGGSSSGGGVRLAARTPSWPKPPDATPNQPATERELFAVLRAAHMDAGVMSEAKRALHGVGTLALHVEPTPTSAVRLHLSSGASGAVGAIDLEGNGPCPPWFYEPQSGATTFSAMLQPKSDNPAMGLCGEWLDRSLPAGLAKLRDLNVQNQRAAADGEWCSKPLDGQHPQQAPRKAAPEAAGAAATPPISSAKPAEAASRPGRGRQVVEPSGSATTEPAPAQGGEFVELTYHRHGPLGFTLGFKAGDSPPWVNAIAPDGLTAELCAEAQASAQNSSPDNGEGMPEAGAVLTQGMVLTHVQGETAGGYSDALELLQQIGHHRPLVLRFAHPQLSPPRPAPAWSDGARNDDANHRQQALTDVGGDGVGRDPLLASIVTRLSDCYRKILMETHRSAGYDVGRAASKAWAGVLRVLEESERHRLGLERALRTRVEAEWLAQAERAKMERVEKENARLRWHMAMQQTKIDQAGSVRAALVAEFQAAEHKLRRELGAVREQCANLEEKCVRRDVARLEREINKKAIAKTDKRARQFKEKVAEVDDLLDNVERAHEEKAQLLTQLGDMAKLCVELGPGPKPQTLESYCQTVEPEPEVEQVSPTKGSKKGKGKSKGKKGKGKNGKGAAAAAAPVVGYSAVTVQQASFLPPPPNPPASTLVAMDVTIPQGTGADAATGKVSGSMPSSADDLKVSPRNRSLEQKINEEREEMRLRELEKSKDALLDASQHRNAASSRDSWQRAPATMPALTTDSQIAEAGFAAVDSDPTAGANGSRLPLGDGSERRPSLVGQRWPVGRRNSKGSDTPDTAPNDVSISSWGDVTDQ